MGVKLWLLTLSEKRRLRVYKNKLLSRIFTPKSDEVRGEWRKLHNKELNDMYSSSNFILVIKSNREE